MERTKKINPKSNNSTEKKQKSRFLTIFICIFASLTLILAATLGIVSAVNNSKAAVKYKGVIMDAETASFFASYYKYRYMGMLSSMGVAGVEDTQGFWNKTYEKEGKTYGELLDASTRAYIGQIVAANYLYDSYDRLSSEDKDIINSAVKEILSYKASGSKKTFNQLVSEYGFSYSSFKNAAKFLYKASTVKELIYGNGGTNIANFPELAAEYLSQYSHVKLLFIRTETAFVLDEDGNRVTEGGYDKTRPLTEEEKAERSALISEIRGYIASAENGGDIQMSDEMFGNYQKNHDDGDSDMHADGYYFHKNSSFTAEFSSEFENIVDKAYQMPIDSYGEVALDFGVCFIYKYIPTRSAYSSSLAEPCFVDFYSDAANYFFEKNITEIGTSVNFTDRFSKIDLKMLPYNYAYFPIF